MKNSSGEDTRENVTVSSTEDVDLAGSRGTAHFAIKWARDARNQANLNVIEHIKGTALQYTGTGRLCYRGEAMAKLLPLNVVFPRESVLDNEMREIERDEYKYYSSFLDDFGDRAAAW